MLSTSDPINKFFPVPEDKRSMTVYNLLTHTMGIGHKNLRNDKTNYENIDQYILGIPSDIPIGTETRVSFQILRILRYMPKHCSTMALRLCQGRPLTPLPRITRKI